MGSMNMAMLVGNVVDDPEMRYMPNGDCVTTFRVATNRFWLDETGKRTTVAEYHRLKAFRKPAETIAKHFKKGRLVGITGRMETRSWVDEATGVRKERMEIVVEQYQFLDGRGEDADPRSRDVGEDRELSLPPIS